MPMLLSEVQAEVESWANSVNGKYIDFDGAYGAQCVDPALHYGASLRSCGERTSLRRRRALHVRRRLLRSPLLWGADFVEAACRSRPGGRPEVSAPVGSGLR